MALAKKSYQNNLNPGAELVWPANLLDSFDHLEIGIAKFVPRTKNVRESSSVGENKSVPVPSSTSLNTSLPRSQVGGRVRSITQYTIKTGSTICVPIPESVNYTDNPQWGNASGLMNNILPGLIKGGAAAAGGEDGASEGLTKSITDAAGAGKVSMLLKMITRLGADPNAVTQNLNGKIANPYLEQVFNGLGMREFTFSWNLVPRNLKEQRSIKDIIKTLRRSILPNINQTFGSIGDTDVDSQFTEIDNQGIDRWLTVPDLFLLKWKSSVGEEIESLPKIKPCACKNIQVSYTPNNVWATHLDDGEPSPVGYNLTLSFGEMEIITGNDVAKGY